jgi:hypothetical protein
MGTFRIEDFQSQSLLLANYAELAAFDACMADTARWPLLPPPGMLPFVVYKTNTITYTCGYHQDTFMKRSSVRATANVRDRRRLDDGLHHGVFEVAAHFVVSLYVLGTPSLVGL